MAGTVTRSLFDLAILRQALNDSVRKLTPRRQVRNPVMFVVYVGSILTTLLWMQALAGKGEAPGWFIFWSRCGSGSRCSSRTSPRPWRRGAARRRPPPSGRPGGSRGQAAPAPPPRGGLRGRLRRQLRKGQVVLVEANDFIPADGRSSRASPP